MRFALALFLAVALLSALPPDVAQALSAPDTVVRHRPARFLQGRSDVPTAHHGTHTVTYAVARLGVSAKGLPGFRRIAELTLSDERGWSAHGSVAFRRVAGDADFTLWLASPAAIAATGVGCSEYYSCRVGDDVYINAMRWEEGADSYDGRSLREYREYVINHEVGHWLGLDHRGCPGPEATSPVMQQQSKGLRGCQARAWPLPGEQRRALDNLAELDELG